MRGKISEIFESIQGEGIYVGEKQVFVRLFGCNLECGYCDTKLDSFKEYEPQELLDELKQFQGDFHSISFTGGEPLLQKDFLKEALRLTAQAGWKNYLETNGTLSEALEEVIDYVHIVSMDLKLPSSTGIQELWQAQQRFLSVASKREVFLKAVICHETNEQDLAKAIKLIKETNKDAILVLQPNSFDEQTLLSGKLENFKEACGREGLISCIVPQMHKIIGVK